jgi:hypothetical protein
MRTLCCELSLMLLFACGPAGTTPKDTTVTTIQQNANPTGFVEGRILDAANGQPVSGATVSTYTDLAITANTDLGGHYRLGPIPAGSYTVFCEGPGYMKSFFSAAIGDPSAMFPIGNTIVTRDVDLARPDASISGQVLTNTGRIAKGAALYLDLRQNGFDYVSTQKAGEDGKFTFTGLPGSAFGEFVGVSVAPYDENEDGIPDYGNSSRSYVLFPGANTYNTIQLFALGVQLVTSNIGDGDLLPNEAISLTFSGKIRTGQSTVTLFRNSGSVQVGTTLTWDATGTVATITPVGGNLVEGQSYFISYSVRADNGAQTSSSLTFVARSSTIGNPPGNVTNFRAVIPAGGLYDSGLTNMTVAWDMPANAGGYHIYGKDLAGASAYLLVASVGSSFTTSANINISIFDSVIGDAFTTPLGYGNKVTLAIVATDRAGVEGSLIAGPTIELSDVVPPSGLSANQIAGSANNLTGGAAAIVQYQLTFSEVMAIDTLPEIILPNAATSAVWAWQTPNRGVFTITIPAGIDGRGSVQIMGGKDSSGLMQATPFVGPALF